MKDFLIVGAGFFGATFARIATDYGKTCLVIDKLPHVAGAAHDKLIEGIMTSSYGAHIMHSDDTSIWSFVSQFSEMIPFVNKPKVISGNSVYSFPINMMTLHQLWGVITPTEAKAKLDSVILKCDNPRNLEEWALSMVGREIYEKFFYGYTKKQWMKDPKDLPSSILKRLPIRLTYDENYFNTKFQGMPENGYTQLVENMLDGIEVRLETDFFLLDWKNLAHHLIYTGPVDKFFNYEYGKLDYNTLKFETKVFSGDIQGNAVFNYADESVPYLRSIEHKHFYQRSKKHYKVDSDPTVITYDYPISFLEHPEPYYPIRDKKNTELYNRYVDLIPDNVTFGGRLGQYQYFDLDQTIGSAINKAKKLCSTQK